MSILNTFTGTSLGQGTDLSDDDMLVLLLPVRIEYSVDDGVHAGIRTRENKADFHYQRVNCPRTLVIKSEPVDGGGGFRGLFTYRTCIRTTCT